MTGEREGERGRVRGKVLVGWRGKGVRGGRV